VSTGTEKQAFERVGDGRRALIIRRGPCLYDSRILREADTLRKIGYEPLILGVISEDVRATRDEQAGTPIIRLEPTSPFAWLRSLQRRLMRRPRPTGVEERDPQPGTESANPLMRLVIRVHRWLRTLDFYRRAIAVVLEERPALVHCNDYNTMWVGVAARLLARSTVIYDSHELWPDRNQRPEPRWWLVACEFLFVHLAHRTITASPGYAQVMAKRYRIAPPAVIRNIPDASMLPRGVGSENGDSSAGDGDRLALYVGALTTGRGLELSIRALNHIDDVRLRLVGPARPAYLAELVELTSREGVSDRVEFAGAVSPDELVETISEAGVGLALIQPVCLSYRMSLPNKVFEYVAAGLPVLGSDLPAISALVNEYRIGLLAEPGEVEDVAAKLGEMLEPERNSAFREAARAAAGELHWDREAVRLADEYRESVRGRSADARARDSATRDKSEERPVS
jgi:glycosyltransferase involved in cell wall biosynthesis